MNKTFGYARVSTAKQNPEPPQFELLQQAGCNDIFLETVNVLNWYDYYKQGGKATR